MIPRVLFVLSILFALFAAVEVANVHLGQEKRIQGKVVMITSVETSTKSHGFMEVKDHQTTHFLVDVALEDSNKGFITRCSVRSLKGLEKNSTAETWVMVGKLYNDNRCLALKLKDEVGGDGGVGDGKVDSFVVHVPPSQ